MLTGLQGRMEGLLFAEDGGDSSLCGVLENEAPIRGHTGKFQKCTLFFLQAL